MALTLAELKDKTDTCYYKQVRSTIRARMRLIYQSHSKVDKPVSAINIRLDRYGIDPTDRFFRMAIEHEFRKLPTETTARAWVTSTDVEDWVTVHLLSAGVRL